MGLKKYHAVLISSNDFWIYDPDSYDSKTKLYGDFTVVKGDSKKEDSDMKRCSYFFEVGNADNHGFKPTAIKYDDAEGFLVIEGEQAPMNKIKRRVFQIGEDARRYKNMRGPRHSVDTVVVSKDSKKKEIKDYLKQQQDDSKGAESFSADTLNQINPIFVEGAEDVMGAESNNRMSELENKAKKLYLDEIDESYIKEVCDEYDLDYHNEKDYAKACSKYLDQIDYIHILDMLDSDDLKELKQLYKDNDISYHKQMGAESEIFCADCGGRRKYDAESFDADGMYENDDGLMVCKYCNSTEMVQGDYTYCSKCDQTNFITQENMNAESFDAEHSCGCGDEMALEAEDDGDQVKLFYEGIYENDDEEDEREGQEIRSHSLISKKEYIDYYHDTKYNPCKCDVQGCLSCFLDEASHTPAIKNGGIRSYGMLWFEDAELNALDAEDDEISCSCESPRIRHAGVHPRTCEACDLVVDAEDIVELVQELSPFPMGKLFASFIVVGVSAIAGAKLLNR